MIEVNCHSVNDAKRLESVEEYIKVFERISIHISCDLRYKNDDQTTRLLKKIEYFIKNLTQN